MKTNKLLATSFFLLGLASVKAQNTFPSSGNVGIGTNTPWTTLQVHSLDVTKPSFIGVTGTAAGVLFSADATSDPYVPAIGLSTSGGQYLENSAVGQFNIRGGIGGDIAFGNMPNNQSTKELMRLKSNGNFGIGTNNPAEKLEVNGNIKFNSILTTDGRMHITGGEYLYLLNKSGVIIGKAWGGNGNLAVEGNTTSHGNILNYGDYLLGKDTKIVGNNDRNGYYIGHYPVAGSDGLDIHWWGGIRMGDSTGNVLQVTNGKIGIGTVNPDQKLTVKGKIHSEEVIVDLQVPADYVFEKYYTGKSSLKSDYIMPTLAEVEKYTKENNHLPNVPSAKEIQEKGLQVGEMTNILLQKIEELTLYTIELKKEIEQLKKSNK